MGNSTYVNRRKRVKERSTEELIEEVTQEALQPEIEKASDRFNIRAAWVAVIFVPVFAITDYLNIPDGWFRIFIIRCSISLITLAMLLGRERLKITSSRLAVISFILISMQNAYTYTLVDESGVLEHSINYIALLIGAGMFLLWPWRNSVAMVLITFAGTAVFLKLNGTIGFEYFLMHGGLLLIVVALFMIALVEFRYSLTVKELKTKLALQISNDLLAKQKAITEQKNEDITDSIHYAKGIQTAILGGTRPVTKWFDEAFVFFEPKDILGGDFYWFHKNEDSGLITIIVADCTGHGVPAALMTVLGNSLLDEIVIQRGITAPNDILRELDLRIIDNLGRNIASGQRMHDGMDMSVLSISGSEVQYAGANNPMALMGKDGLRVIKGSKFPIGSEQYDKEKVFAIHSLPRVKGDRLYLYTDGFQDQFGGPDGRKYMSRNFRDLLKEISALPMNQQLAVLRKDFREWKGDNDQTDDVLVVGILL